jgi:Linear amide C-N hydrolases, choloylglycine hydrolase family/Secretion system C-terminal sorting domain
MKKLISFTILCFLITTAFADDSRADTLATINSFSHLGDFHTINYVGDYEYILDFLDNQFLDGNEQIDEMGCSLYSGLGDANNIFLGRNFDNPQQDVLVGKYAAPGCYESIAVNRLSDMGLPVGTNFFNLNSQQELLLLRAPYFACDGMNEMGLAVGVAYVDAVPVEVDPNKESIWLTRWIREILDHAANVQEAIDITNSYNILDNFYGQNTICHHLLITDNSGASVILEYHDGAFEEIYPEVDWQVLTNTHIYNHTLQQMFNLCYRYELLYDALEDQSGEIYDWRNGLDILELPTWGNLTNGTQWSSLFDVSEEVMYLSLYRDFANIARVDIENFEFLNFGDFHLDDLTVQDENSNGLIEPGEDVFLVSTLSVDFLSTGVMCELSCDDPGIDITSGSFYFGDILPGQQTSNITQLFTFEVLETISSQSIEIKMQLTTDYGYEYEITLPFDISGVDSDDVLLKSNENELQIYPNPFNPSTTISFEITLENNKIHELEIFNLKGQKVRAFPVTLSDAEYGIEGAITWNGTDSNNQQVSSGIYYCVLRNNGKISASKKMMLMK